MTDRDRLVKHVTKNFDTLEEENEALCKCLAEKEQTNERLRGDFESLNKDNANLREETRFFRRLERGRWVRVWYRYLDSLYYRGVVLPPVASGACSNGD